ncbi:MAG TPA: AMP-binding protein, partial [Steroidobacteraceae bacterium]|nr:AMP-binding protein [Steroidobacteraceae bacterium]
DASLVSLIESSFARFAARPAFHNFGTTITYADLDRLSRHLAAHLQSAGLGKGDRIALVMPNLLQYPLALFAALRAGLTVVNTNPSYTARELGDQLRDSGARAVIALETSAHVLAEVLHDTSVEHVVITTAGELLPFPKGAVINFVTRHVKHLVPRYRLPRTVSLRRALADGAQRRFQAAHVTADDIAFLQYTGGTTGTPKGAVLSHRNVVANLDQLNAVWGGLIEPGVEIVITPLPLYHVFCLTCNCLLFAQHGGLNVLITDPRDIPAFVRELARWRFSIITGVNTLYAALLAHPGFAGLSFSSLKIAVAGGMSLHPAVARKWRAVTGRPMIEGYGLTEASPVVACNTPDGAQDGSVGPPLPGTEISIREGDVEVARGEPGELWIRGPQVMHGYWNRPDDTRNAFTDGWLRTGDVAVLEAGGRLRIVDRKKDMIIVSGFKVFPNEVEAVVESHPAVAESGCIAVPDDRSGQAVAVFVVPRPGHRVSIEELRQYCRERLAPYKVPKHIEFRDTLPKSNVGKVLRRKLSVE